MSYKYNPLLVGKLDQIGANELNELDDVNTAGTVDGYVLTYGTTLDTWTPKSGGAGDMLKAEYVTGSGTVYNASRLEGETLATVQAHNVDASKITTGTFGLARIPAVDDARIPDLETLSYGAAFATAQVPAVGAYKIASGTLAVARHEILDNLNGTVALTQVPTMDDAHVPDLETLSYGAAFATAQIPAIGAYKIASGTLAVARHEILDNLNGTVALTQVPTMDDAHIPDVNGLSYGAAFATAQIPAIGAYKTATGTLGLARIPAVDDARIPDLETLSYGAAFATAQVPAVGAYKIASGTLAVARHEILDNLNGTVALTQVPTMDDAHVPDLETLSYGAAFATAQIPAIGAYKIASGTLNADRIPILPTDRYGSAVLLTGAQSIGGTKTFTDIPILPASDPSADNEAARKAYVDSAAAGDIDGGLYSDTYINTANINGGTF